MELFRACIEVVGWVTVVCAIVVLFLLMVSWLAGGWIEEPPEPMGAQDELGGVALLAYRGNIDPQSLTSEEVRAVCASWTPPPA